MRHHNYYHIFVTSLVLTLGSCTSEDFWDTFDRTVDGPIDFTVGVDASPARRALTRAGEEDTPAASDTCYALQFGTQLRLRVDGFWKRIPETGLVTQQATCKAEAPTSDVNTLTYDEGQTLYWDDYGTGDPDNADNKAKGLSVLAVAVDGKDMAPKIGNDAEWVSKEWAVVTDGKDVLSGDILVSNNLTGYTFADRDKADAQKLIFKHPLSKITFNITAGEGFKDGFEQDPVLTLSNATTLADIEKAESNYALTTGTVRIKDATATSDGNKAKVIAGTISGAAEKKNVVKAAIVYPGTQLGTDNGTVLGVLQADGNVYYIKAGDIRTKIEAIGGHDNFKTLPGYNYIIKITVNKTGIRTTASVVNWHKVESDEVLPKINVDATIGASTDTKPSFGSFAFWRSEEIDKSYQREATPTINSDGTMDWSKTQLLYWPNHNTHYHLRGVYPAEIDVKSDADDKLQYIEVANGAYAESSFPSNLMIGMPEIAEGTMCGNPEPGHEQVDMSKHGICAREATINLNFRYMMSQVEVKLTSSDASAANHVDLSKAVVELVNVGTEGHILLEDRSAKVMTDGQTYSLPSVDDSSIHYHGVIIPQPLKDDNGNKVRFKITVTDEHDKKSVYYADVAPIKVKADGGTAAATDAWQAGVHYVYNLNITKTEIQATASLTPWKTVEASEEVWF